MVSSIWIPENHTNITTFTTPSTCAFIVIRVGNGSSVAGTTYPFNIMLVEGSHALPYQPYEGSIVHEKELTSDISTINSSIATTNTNVSTLDAQNVKLTGDQTVSGVKTFSGSSTVVSSLNFPPDSQGYKVSLTN
jgi:hypothetical protein